MKYYKMPTKYEVPVCVYVCFGTNPTAQKDTRKVLREILARSASFSTLRDKIVLVKFHFFFSPHFHYSRKLKFNKIQTRYASKTITRHRSIRVSAIERF